MNKFIFLFLILYFTSNTFSREISDSGKFSESKTLSRLKLSGGYIIGKNYSEALEDSPFLNFNYHATELNKLPDQFDFGFAAEAGVNFFNGYFPFYLKIGPEIVPVKNIIVSINIGYSGIFVFPQPFYGLNGYYLFELSNSIYMELESGFHFLFPGKDSPIFYFNVGFSVN